MDSIERKLIFWVQELLLYLAPMVHRWLLKTMLNVHGEVENSH